MTVATAPADAVIHYQDVSKRFRTQGKEVVALDNVSLTVGRNEFTSVVGPSGCGKTTLLRLGTGLEVSTTGKTIFEGEVVRGVNTRAGYVTQDSNLYPWMTLRENVEFSATLWRGQRRSHLQSQRNVGDGTGKT